MNGSRTGRIAMAAVFAAIAACSDDVFDPDTLNNFTATLNGASVKPTATTETATATATFTYDAAAGEIDYSIVYTGLSEAPTLAHIHVGGPTTGTGAVQLNLCGTGGAVPGCPSTTSGTISGTATSAAGWTVGTGVTIATVVSNMRGFNAYVNLHKSGGAVMIRGNVVGVY